jgi:predicted outer membrane repeat protein
MRLTLIVTLLYLSLLLLPSRADSRVWHVPSEVPTIAAAVDAAIAGDIVEIAPGTYAGCPTYGYDPAQGSNRPVCVVLKSGVRMRGSSGTPGDVIINALGAGGVLFAVGIQGAVVEAVTIKGGSTTITWNGSGGGLYSMDSAAEFINCVFVGNSSPDHGGGVFAFRSDAGFSQCTFTGNLAATSGGALYSADSVLRFQDCAFTSNSVTHTAEVSGGGALYFHSCQATVERCSLESNVTSGSAGGIMVHGSSGSATIASCLFSGNAACWGGALKIYSSAVATVTDCTFQGNQATVLGGAVDCLSEMSNSLSHSCPKQV